jgi:NAD(P)-dependent dehydrogenase (short-subunit alcohol dehydrogenase family)
MDKKVVLITGASSGMGKETALQLIREGHIVYGGARRVDKMQNLVDNGGHAIQMDVTDHDSIVKGIKKIVDEQGRIDVLWNNAGYAVYGAVEDVSLEDARRQFEVNLFGVAAITKEVLPVMRKQKSGRIINTSSMGGKIYTLFGAWYHATKHAIEGWSDCLRLELKQFNIDVVVLEPGLIQTEFYDVLYEPFKELSKNGAYKDLANKFLSASEKKPMPASPPSVIAKTVSKAINAKKPKTRYVAGKMAKPLMFIRKWFGDKVYDRIIMSQMG